MKKEFFIDVRTDSEWKDGHVPDAIHFELSKLISGELPEIEKDTKIFVYCRSGGRAEIAKDILIKNGFSDVSNIGGYEDAILLKNI